MTIGGKTVSIGGHCKGSGMIHPNMATMLGVVTCDAVVESDVWRGMVKRASMASFNQVGDGGAYPGRGRPCLLGTGIVGCMAHLARRAQSMVVVTFPGWRCHWEASTLV